MNAKHTPGPWRFRLDRVAYTGYEVYPEQAKEQSECICSLWGDGSTDLANARLIAAAPDLLEALKSSRRIAALHMKARGFTPAQIADAFPDTDAAIAKAEGRDE